MLAGIDVEHFHYLRKSCWTALFFPLISPLPFLVPGPLLFPPSIHTHTHTHTSSTVQITSVYYVAFPDGASGKEPVCQCRIGACIRDSGLIPRSGRFPGEEGRATHSSVLVWEIPWTEEPGGLHSIRSQRVRHNQNNLACTLCRQIGYSVLPKGSLLSTKKNYQCSPRCFPQN